MQYKEPENWNQPEECVPRYDSDGDALNCIECNQKVRKTMTGGTINHAKIKMQILR